MGDHGGHDATKQGGDGAWARVQVSTTNTLPQPQVTPAQLEAALTSDTVVIDIRPPAEYNAGFIQGSVNIPLYQPISGWEQRKVLRRLGFALFGVLNGTEINPNFLEQLQEAAPDLEAGAILVCNLGGSMTPVGEHKKGQQSRSLFAAYELTRVGYKNVRVLAGGYNGWRADGRDVYFVEE